MKIYYQKNKAKLFSFILLCITLQTNLIFSALADGARQTTADLSSGHDDTEIITYPYANNDKKIQKTLADFIGTKTLDPEHGPNDLCDGQFYTDKSCLLESQNGGYSFYDGTTGKYHQFDSDRKLIK